MAGLGQLKKSDSPHVMSAVRMAADLSLLLSKKFFTGEKIV
jgi:hypothetical protein